VCHFASGRIDTRKSNIDVPWSLLVVNAAELRCESNRSRNRLDSSAANELSQPCFFQKKGLR
jgi:hypothetical protein